jgi:hypothetical protein
MAITKASLIDLNGQELILDADADTSITADTDDVLDFKTGGTDRLKISGNNLHLNGGTDARIQLGSGGAGANSTSNDTVHIRGDGDHLKLMSAANGGLYYEENGTARLSIASGGKVGIGTASPSTKLHLGGTAPGDSIIRQDSTSSGTNWEIGERVAGKWQIFEDDGDKIVATFQSNGNVGIGTSAPAVVNNGAGRVLDLANAGSAGTTG